MYNDIKDILLVLAGLGLVVEITPIKINPYKWLLTWIGKSVNKPLYERMDKIDDDIKEMRMEAYEKEVRDIRGEILDFANSCHNKRKHTGDEFIHIIDQITRYENLINKHNIKNGVIEVQARYIKDLYKECMREGTLL